MKQFLLFLTFLTSLAVVNAQTSQPLFIENFTGYNNSNLNGQGSWSNSGNDNYAQVSNTSPLLFTGYTSGSQYVNLVQRADYINFTSPYFHSPDDPYKNF